MGSACGVVPRTEPQTRIRGQRRTPAPCQNFVMVAPTKTRTLQQLLQEVTPDRKLLVLGPGPEKLQDSRFSIGEVGDNYVAIKLLGEELLIIPFSSIITVKAERTQVTIRLR